MTAHLADDPADLCYDQETLDWAVAFRARTIIDAANLPMPLTMNPVSPRVLTALVSADIIGRFNAG